VYNAANATLLPGVYSLVVLWFGALSADRCVNATLQQQFSVLPTATVVNLWPHDARMPPSSRTRDTQNMTRVSAPTSNVGATFRFTTVPLPPLPLLSDARNFVDCEEVACAGLPTGFFNISGERAFCDNDASGGGWTRVFRVNDSSCETKGWTSKRNEWAEGLDPVGCRPGGTACKRVEFESPFAYNEVLGKDWKMFSKSTPDAFFDGDGVEVASNDSHVWTFAFSHPDRRCPCGTMPRMSNVTDFRTRLNQTGDSFFCDWSDSQSSSSGWIATFEQGSNRCRGDVNAGPRNASSFQRSLPVNGDRTDLSVSLCRSQSDGDEDIKLAALDLYVRRTVGFNRMTSCPTTTAAATTTNSEDSGRATVMSTTTTRTTTGTGTMARTLSATGVTTSAALDSVAGGGEVDRVPLIAGVVGGVIIAILLIGLVVFVARRISATKKSRAQQQQQQGTTMSQVPQSSEYGSFRVVNNDNNDSDYSSALTGLS
jgi:hypothetical protein